MGTQQNSDTVSFIFSKKDKYLVIEYSVTRTDRSSLACQKEHKESLKKRKRRWTKKPKVKTKGSKLLIKCGFKFQVEPTRPSTVQTLKEEDAEILRQYFFQLDSKVDETHDLEWPWELCLEDAYDWDEWMTNISPIAMAKASKQERPTV
ncbi:hypothetical protein COCC4DRAFT_69267 [Bipolaris maydis ATCC 48331]|uniref:Uncharacterized protein n=2 Tax=Cochliobolus heterostrophus TaxID=5016 RepID=M2TZB8_COCH5|nr:uncharacterized protein COCC4DRAFT_69267 [Bipolaris maydis ATCC 48331]EMD91639.1 hypothetical protein COCHEDRAFT_1203841 [Bipolaris maydis C5]ENI08604.1 hypothetical protein COCC4DRAFT_69267 [Bipolaris maydis ATCC 48331]